MEYTVSMRVEGRVDVSVEASSFDEAFMRARTEMFDPDDVEVIDFAPVNATDEHGNMKDY